MNSGYLYRRRAPVPLQELLDLIKKSGSPAWRLQEGIDTLEFKQADKDWLDGLPTSLWPQGRVFGSQAEIRWWTVDGDRYDILLLSEAKIELSSDVWHEKEMEISKQYPMYLWGKRQSTDQSTDPYWIETRIPHPLNYPIDEDEWQKRKSEYVAIRACDYSNNGVVQLTRLIRLEPIDKSYGGNHV